MLCNDEVSESGTKKNAAARVLLMQGRHVAVVALRRVVSSAAGGWWCGSGRSGAKPISGSRTRLNLTLLVATPPLPPPVLPNKIRYRVEEFVLFDSTFNLQFSPCLSQ